MTLLDRVLWTSVLVVFVSGLFNFIIHYVLGLQHLTCLGGLGTVKPLVEHQFARDVSYVFSVTQQLEKMTTKYQLVEVFAHAYLGNILVIDQSVQITEKDEANYHEMMVHVPLAYMPKAKKVLMIGGGDGGAVFRALQHDHIEHAALVDIDMRTMREISRKYFSMLYQAYTDPRTVAYSFDGAEWLEDQLADEANHGTYELIMADTTDYGAASSLFTDHFYAGLKRLMHPETSILVLNVDSPSWNMDTVIGVQRQLSTMFKYAYIYHTHQPTFLSGHYSFLFASNNIDPMTAPIDWSEWHRKKIPTYYYTPEIHYASFMLPAMVSRHLTMSGRLSSVTTFP